MTQKNEMSARALTMEELENVNGGRPQREPVLNKTFNKREWAKQHKG